MWANNEVGTVQPVTELAAVARAYGVPFHSDAVQAFGQLPVDFAASGLDAMTRDRPQDRRPARAPGCSSSAAARTSCRCCTAAARSATSAPAPSTPRPSSGSPRPPRWRRSGSASGPSSSPRLRDDLVRRVLEVVPDAVLGGDPDLSAAHRLPGNAHFSFPGCEGDALLLLLDARGIECSTGSACSAGVPQPSHVLLAMGVPEGAGPRLAAVLPRPHLDRGRRRRRRRGDRPGRRARPQGRPERHRSDHPTDRSFLTIRGTRMRVLAAMSGGVDSAVAAARAVEAGHDVTGVHLALSSNPASFRTGARGCCTMEDARDAAPRRRRHRHPVLRLGPGRAVPRRTSSTTSSRSTPPAARRTRACAATRRSSSPRCSTRRWPSASTPSCTGHYARVDGRPAAPRRRRGQGPVLRPRRPDRATRSAHAMFPLGDTRKADVRREAETPRAGRRRQAGQPRHLLHRRRRHRGLPAAPARLGARPGRRHRRRAGRGARGRVRVHRRAAQGPADRPARRRTACPATCSTCRR